VERVDALGEQRLDLVRDFSRRARPNTPALRHRIRAVRAAPGAASLRLDAGLTALPAMTFLVLALTL